MVDIWEPYTDKWMYTVFPVPEKDAPYIDGTSSLEEDTVEITDEERLFWMDKGAVSDKEEWMNKKFIECGQISTFEYLRKGYRSPPASAEWENIHAVIFDFDGVFTDNTVYIDSCGREMVRCNRSDSIGIQRLKEMGVVTFVLTNEHDPVVRKRCEKMGIEVHETSNGDKFHHLARMSQGQDSEIPDFTRIAYVGNDLADIAVMEVVGFPIAVADAYADVKQVASYVTALRGGHGAVREVCDGVYFAKYRAGHLPR